MIDHITLHLSDLAVARDFYTRVLAPIGYRLGVDATHDGAAMAAGAIDNGGPGVRAHYHANYDGAFVLDPDGNNIEAVCRPPGQPHEGRIDCG